MAPKLSGTIRHEKRDKQKNWRPLVLFFHELSLLGTHSVLFVVPQLSEGVGPVHNGPVRDSRSGGIDAHPCCIQEEDIKGFQSICSVRSGSQPVKVSHDNNDAKHAQTYWTEGARSVRTCQCTRSQGRTEAGTALCRVVKLPGSSFPEPIRQPI